VIVLAVRWYLRFPLSYRGVEELLAERGIQVDHVTIYRWVQRFTPLLAEVAAGILDGLEADQEDGFPDPTSRAMARTWWSNPKASERAFAGA
jgi:hypothetical protein